MGNYLRAYSMEYGTFVGLGWSAAFLTYVYGVMGSGLLLIACMACMGFSLVLPFVLAMRVNSRMAADGATASYWQGLMFSFSMLMYACLLHGIVVYGYFELLDHGSLMAAMSELLGSAELAGLYAQMGMGEQHRQMMALMGEVGAMGSLDKAMLMFNNDFMLSVMLAFLVAVPASWRRSGGAAG